MHMYTNFGLYVYELSQIVQRTGTLSDHRRLVTCHIYNGREDLFPVTKHTWRQRFTQRARAMWVDSSRVRVYMSPMRIYMQSHVRI